MKKQKYNSYKEIEMHLRHYKSYIVGINNLKRKLELIFPNITTNYELREDRSSVFIISSSTEETALCRLESKEALDIHEAIFNYQLIVDSINAALKDMNETEKRFIQIRYFECKSFETITQEMNFSIRTVNRIRERILKKLSISLRNLKNMRVY